MPDPTVGQSGEGRRVPEPKPSRDDPRVTFGPPEVVGEHIEQYVVMPRVFLFSPEQELGVRSRTVHDIRYKRFENWYEDGRLMGRWTWVTADDMRTE